MAWIIVAEACGSPIAKSLKTLAEIYLFACGDTPRNPLKSNNTSAEIYTPSLTYYDAPALGVGQRVNKDLSK